MPDELKPKRERIFLMRRQDKELWREEIAQGNDIARLVISATNQWFEDRRNGVAFSCVCCENMFGSADGVNAFIVNIPIRQSDGKVMAIPAGVCNECGTQDDDWIIDQALCRPWLSFWPPGDSIH